jgi:hypothetical protein
MDIFDVLNAITKKKIKFMHSGVNEHDAWIKAELDISQEYHISLSDIRKLLGHRFRNPGA